MQKSKSAITHKLYKFLEASLSQTFFEYHCYLRSSNIKNNFNELGNKDSFEYLQKNYFSAKCLMHSDFENFLPFDVLTKVDRASMHYGIEARVPLLSNDLIDICLSNNNKDHFFNNNQSKSVLRDIVKDLKLLNYSYPKRGFGIPIDVWLRDGEINFVYDLVMSSNYDYVNKDEFKELWKDHQSYKVNYGDKILSYFILTNWLINNENTS